MKVFWLKQDKMKKRLTNIIIFLLGVPSFVFAQTDAKKTVTLKINIREEDTRQITPAMVCITSIQDGTVRLPPFAEISIALSPGKWKISIEHGNEYVPISELFEVSASAKGLAKNYNLKRWINLPQLGWYSGDVHVHHPTTKPQFKDFLLEYASAEDIHL